MRLLVLSAVLLAALSATASAQPNIADRRAGPESSAPGSGLPEDSKPSDLLRAAQGAVVTGHRREAQERLEMAQTRLLDRSVPLGQTHDPSASPAVGQISRALQALAAGDRSTCLDSIQAAIGAATAEGS